MSLVFNGVIKQVYYDFGAEPVRTWVGRIRSLLLVVVIFCFAFFTIKIISRGLGV